MKVLFFFFIYTVVADWLQITLMEIEREQAEREASRAQRRRSLQGSNTVSHLGRTSSRVLIVANTPQSLQLDVKIEEKRALLRQMSEKYLKEESLRQVRVVIVSCRVFTSFGDTIPYCSKGL